MRTPLKIRLGSILQDRRIARSLTQRDLAERAGISQKYLGEVERGDANVTIEALEKIATELDWDPWQLFNSDPTPISQHVYQLLVADLEVMRGRIQSMLDWLRALNPLTGSPGEIEEQAHWRAPLPPGLAARARAAESAPIVSDVASEGVVQEQREDGDRDEVGVSHP